MSIIKIPEWLANRPIDGSDTAELLILSARNGISCFSDINLSALKEFFEHQPRPVFYKLVRILGFYGVIFSGRLVGYTGTQEGCSGLLCIPSLYWHDKIDHHLKNAHLTAPLYSCNITTMKQLHGVPFQNFIGLAGVTLPYDQILSDLTATIRQANRDFFNDMAYIKPLPSLTSKEDEPKYVANFAPASQTTLSSNSRPASELAVETLQLSVRSRNCLRNTKITTVAELFRLSDQELLSIPNFGRKSLREIRSKLSRLLQESPEHLDLQSQEILDRLRTNISSLPLSFHSRDRLQKEEISEIWQLVRMTEADVLNIRNLGRKSYEELKENVERLGFGFGMQFTPEQIDSLLTYHNGPIRPYFDIQSTEVMRKLRSKVSDLPLSFRSRGCLGKKKVLEIWQLIQMTETDILKTRNLGRKSLRELKEQVENLGFSFGMQFTPEQINAIRAFVYGGPEQPLSELIQKVLTTLSSLPLPFLNAKENLVLNARFFKVGKPKTLEAIATELFVSRERIRQLEKTACNKIKQQLKGELREIASSIRKKVKNVGGLGNIDDLFDNELARLSKQEQTIITRLLALMDETLFIDWEMGLITTKGQEWIFSLFDEIQDQILQNESDRFFTRQELVESARTATNRHGIFLDQDTHKFLKLFFQIKKISAIKDLLCFGRITKQDNILLVFKKSFPQGLEIYKRRDELLQRLQEFDQEMFRHSSPRSVLARLADHPDILLWGRGFFIHKDHVSYDPIITEKIACWIVDRFDRGHSRFQIDVPFNAFRNDLQSAGIPNQYALYVLLRRVGNTRIGQRKFPTLVDTEADIDIREGILAELENYLFEAGRAVPYEDLKEEFLVRKGWKPYSLQQNITVHTDLIYPWQGNTYIHMEYMQVNEARLEEFMNALRRKLDSIQGAFSLKGARREMNVLWEQVCPGASVRTMVKLIRSVDPSDLHIEGYFIRRIDAASEPEGFSVVGEFEEYFLEQGTELSKFRLKQEFCQERGWSDNQYYSALRQARLFKSGKNSLLHPNTINWNETLSNQVHEILTHHVLERNKNRHPHMQIEPLIYEFVLPELPDEIQWTRQLLQSVGTEYGDFIFFDDAYIRVNNEFDIEDLDDMIAFLIARHFPLGIAKRKEVEQLLWREGILESGKAIPEDQFFEDSSIIRLQDSDEIGLSPIGYERFDGVSKSERSTP